MPRIEPKAGSNQPINIFKTMDHCPHLLAGFKAFKGELDKGHLSGEVKEKIALAVAGINDCAYCKAAHTAMAKKAGVSDGGIEYALQCKCGDPKINAALKFAGDIVNKKGEIDDADLQAVQEAGWTTEEVMEIFGQVMLNMITNYFNHMVDTDVDF